MFTKLTNELALAQAEQLTQPKSLAAGVAAFEAQTGSLEERLQAAVRAACLIHLQPEDEIDLPDDVNELGKQDLRRLADAHSVHTPSSMSADEMRRRLREEAERRASVNATIAARDNT